MKLRIMLLMVTAFLTGCATNTPIPEGYKGVLATVHDTVKAQDKTLAYFFELTNVDGRSVASSTATTMEKNYGQGFNMAPSENSREVPATKSTLSIQGVSHYAAPILALGGENYAVKGDVTVDLKPNQHYYVKGSLGKSYSAVWLEDSKGRMVSEKIQSGVAPTANAVADNKGLQGARASVYFFNKAGFMHKLDGTDSITVTLDGKRIGSASAGKYLKVDSVVGPHQVKLSHRDMVEFSSSHDLTVQAPATYVQISPTIMSNSLSVAESMPSDIQETAYKH